MVVKEKNKSGNIIKKQKVFKSNNQHLVFTIGRGNDCDFAFTKNKNLSKVHCIFVYDNMILKKNVGMFLMEI